MRIVNILAAALLAAVPAAAQNTQKFNIGKAEDYGLTYSLPRTAVDVTVEALFTERTPGEFANYARRYLNITDAITQPSTTVEVQAVVVDTRGVADDANRWSVKFKSGSPMYAVLDPKGALLSLNTEQTAAVQHQTLPAAREAAPTALELPAAREAMTEEMIRSASLSKRAELAARRIFELREMRSDLMSGQADNTPPDGQSLQLALDNISAQEAALTAMFAGTVKTYTRVATGTLMPSGGDESESKVLLRLSPLDGFVGADDLSGEPITVSVSVTEHATLPLNEKGEQKRMPKNAVAYSIPGTARVTVSYRDRVLATANVQLSQAGVVFGLDPDLFSDKKAPSRLQLSPVTGAVVLLGPAQ